MNKAERQTLSTDKKTDYQKTLNLPSTKFSMKAGLTQKEPQILKNWEELQLSVLIRKQCEGKEPFILHDGPPYANGNIHIGHALNKILKDFVVKSKTMQGLDSLYVPGWDCHGLPIEHQLIEKLKKKKAEVEPVAFRKQAHDFAMKFVSVQREQFKRLGVLGEWDKPYLTLDPEYEYWILKSFGRLAEKGYVYRGLKPVNWCANCETALAEAEVEYEDHTSTSIYVKFKVNNPEALGDKVKGKPVSLLIWTTTPWTLLANVAVAYNPAFDYILVNNDGEYLIVEKSLAENVLSKNNAPYEQISEFKGDKLKNSNYVHPFGLKENCKVVPMEYVTREDGTGLVHTAPGHGQEDFEAGKVHKLDMLMPVNDRGVYTKEAGPYEGRHVFKANAQIIEDLKNKGALFAEETLAHSYPHCWRCKKPIIFRATKQWFLKIDHQSLRSRIKNVIKTQVQWIPPAGEERILGMVSTRPDWCLSRQRHWGVPIPAVTCKGCQGENKLFGEVIERFALMAQKEGSDAWFERDLKELLPGNFKCPDCGGNEFEKTYDILDVWFDSGVSHQAVIEPRMKRTLPVGMYLEGSDQHRGWFQSSLIPAVALEGKAPYKSVLTHGFVVDGQGRKMSKSLGNVMAPDDVIKHNGVDILRLWVASSSYNEDVRISDEIIARLVDAYRKIRNTMRYLLGNLNGYNPDTDEVDYRDMQELDQWALFKLREVSDAARKSYGRYEFAKVYKMIYAFCNEDLSGFYLDILKDRLYTSHISAQERRSAQSVLFHIVNHLTRLLAPLLVFTSEEIYGEMPKTEEMQGRPSVHLLQWLDAPAEWNNRLVDQKFKILTEIRPFVLKALEDKRREGVIGSSLEAKIVFSTASDRDFEYLEAMQDMLPAAFIVSQVEFEKVKDIKEGLSEQFSLTRVRIDKASGDKCARCWNYRTTVGKDQEHPVLCSRCCHIVKQLNNNEEVINQ